jgi:hypothetical protein
MNQYRHAVVGWVQARAPFSLIEDRINEMDELSEDQRAALYLYAWTLKSTNTPRRMLAEANETLEMVE